MLKHLQRGSVVTVPWRDEANNGLTENTFKMSATFGNKCVLLVLWSSSKFTWWRGLWSDACMYIAVLRNLNYPLMCCLYEWLGARLRKCLALPFDNAVWNDSKGCASMMLT